ncbi:MAG: hypothetical protein FWD28_00470 [Treponema sp.]|nr:hypothetical protein [Treponema sp.]
MTIKPVKTDAFFINIRIPVIRIIGQLCIILCIVSLISCNGNGDDLTIVPPETSPLTRNYIGFGVITSSFTHINEDPTEESRSLGYLRRGSLVKIIRRQVLRTAEGFISWVLIDEWSESGEVKMGWLREDVMEIYNNESQARTASELSPK